MTSLSAGIFIFFEKTLLHMAHLNWLDVFVWKHISKDMLKVVCLRYIYYVSINGCVVCFLMSSINIARYVFWLFFDSFWWLLEIAVNTCGKAKEQQPHPMSQHWNYPYDRFMSFVRLPMARLIQILSLSAETCESYSWLKWLKHP